VRNWVILPAARQGGGRIRGLRAAGAALTPKAMTKLRLSRRTFLLASAAASLAGPVAAATASEELKALFAASDAADLRLNPLNALYRGDTSRAGELGDLFADAWYDQSRQAAESELAALKRIDRAKLSPDEQVAYDVFAWQRDLDRRGLSGQLLKTSQVLPLNHFYGIHNGFAELSSGQGGAPYKTVKDYEDGLSRLNAFPPILDRAADRMRQGVAAGVTQPKLIMRNVLEQLDTLIGQGVEGSTFYKPVTAFPADIPAADQARLRAAYGAAIRDRVLPALTRARDYIRDDYMPHARDSVGLYGMKGGEALYRYLVEVNTTTAGDPEEIHRLGLSEVARIHGEMEAVKAKVGFTGTLKAFFEHIRTDPKFQPPSKQWLIDGYHAIGARVAKRLPEMFGTLPKTRLEIQPTPALTEKGAARGSYQSGTPDGSRPGVFYFNTYDLPSRSIPSMETLYLHEGAPGHHFQISLAQENESLPAFMRFGGNTAFVEGWGLYAESLGPELGMYADPYQYFGYLDSELFRAIRLVVDTGIHAKGWTRDQSIDYILANSSRGRSNATAETERYIAIPGQALAYKMGQLKIRAARTRAEKALGPKFDLKGFHDQVLMTGALPLAVLDAKIDRWVRSRA